MPSNDLFSCKWPSLITTRKTSCWFKKFLHRTVMWWPLLVLYNNIHSLEWQDWFECTTGKLHTLSKSIEWIGLMADTYWTRYAEIHTIVLWRSINETFLLSGMLQKILHTQGSMRYPQDFFSLNIHSLCLSKTVRLVCMTDNLVDQNCWNPLERTKVLHSGDHRLSYKVRFRLNSREPDSLKSTRRNQVVGLLHAHRSLEECY